MIAISCSSTRHAGSDQPSAYVPASQALYDSIVHMDSVWEDSYNNCKLDLQEELISDDLEFYHDQGGLMTSKKLLIQALERNICGKVTRELLPGSIEVYPIRGYGAVEMGLHRFHGKNEAGHGDYARFIHLWHSEHGRWRITRVISLH
ncbi:nuclear transport factor 2 family protein [Ohtaekwangia sp.]